MAAVQTAGPNLFELTFEDTKIVYRPDGIGGAPQLDYEGPMGRHSFAGEEIQTFESARGLEISVTLDGVSHLRTITLTVFLPELELEEPTAQLSFRTVGIHSTRRRPIASAAGEPMTSEPLEFEGLARNIEFQNAGSTVLL